MSCPASAGLFFEGRPVLLLDQADVAAVSRQVYLALFLEAKLDLNAMPPDRHSKAADRWIAFLNPIFWEAAFGVATWSVAAYVAILFVAWMRPLLERLLLTYAVGAIFTLLMQTYARFDQCVGIVACTFSFGKGVVWSAIWPVAWIIGRGAS